jgi:putative spermidine/putrescine transport system permease protein
MPRVPHPGLTAEAGDRVAVWRRVEARRAAARAGEGWGLLTPLAGFLVVYYLLPLGFLFAYSLAPRRGGGLTLANYAAFLGDPFLLKTLWVTIRLGLETTVIVLVLGYPMAYVASRGGPGLRRIFVFLAILPLLTSTVVRSFAWVVILGRRGLVNDVLLGLGLLEEPAKLLFNLPAVRIALAQVHLPLMVLPLLNALDRIDPALEQAAISLGASRARAFWRVTVPLSLPGVLAGSVFNFALSISAFVTPALVGGGGLTVLPTLIYQRAIVSLNWTLAATASVILLVTALLVILAGQRLARGGWRAA